MSPFKTCTAIVDDDCDCGMWSLYVFDRTSNVQVKIRRLKLVGSNDAAVNQYDVVEVSSISPVGGVTSTYLSISFFQSSTGGTQIIRPPA